MAYVAQSAHRGAHNEKAKYSQHFIVGATSSLHPSLSHTDIFMFSHRNHRNHRIFGRRPKGLRRDKFSQIKKPWGKAGTLRLLRNAALCSRCCVLSRKKRVKQILSHDIFLYLCMEIPFRSFFYRHLNSTDDETSPIHYIYMYALPLLPADDAGRRTAIC